MKFVRKSLPIEAAKSIINVSRKDYGNNLTGHMRLQKVLNGAARLLYGALRFSHNTPLLRDKLHWLKCRKRVQFKLCVTIYKALHNMVSVDLKELCILSANERRSTLHLADKQGLVNNRSSSTFLEGAFSIAGKTAWTLLPVYIRQESTLDAFE